MGSFTRPILLLGANQTVFVDSGLEPGKVYHYWVRAYSYTLGYSGITEDAHGTAL